MDKIIDYTTMNPTGKANKKLRLISCPECGKIGRLTKYTDGSASIAHKGHVAFGLFNVDEYCFLKL